MQSFIVIGSKGFGFYEWSKFDHSHRNAMSPLTLLELTFPLWCYFYFFPDSPTEVTHAWNFTHDGSKHALWRKEMPFGVHTMSGNILGFKISRKPSKMAFYRHVQAATNGFKTNDVIEDWRHWLRFVQAERRILFIASWKSPLFCIFQWSQRNDSVSWCTIFGTEIQFLLNLYSIFVGNLFYRLSHKKIS